MAVSKHSFIPESDLYRLVVRSKLPEAERFERWIFEEVLPSIRQYGGYLTPTRCILCLWCFFCENTNYKLICECG